MAGGSGGKFETNVFFFVRPARSVFNFLIEFQRANERLSEAPSIRFRLRR